MILGMIIIIMKFLDNYNDFYPAERLIVMTMTSINLVMIIKSIIMIILMVAEVILMMSSVKLLWSLESNKEKNHRQSIKRFIRPFYRNRNPFDPHRRHQRRPLTSDTALSYVAMLRQSGRIVANRQRVIVSFRPQSLQLAIFLNVFSTVTMKGRETKRRTRNQITTTTIKQLQQYATISWFLLPVTLHLSPAHHVLKQFTHWLRIDHIYFADCTLVHHLISLSLSLSHSGDFQAHFQYIYHFINNFPQFSNLNCNIDLINNTDWQLIKIID